VKEYLAKGKNGQAFIVTSAGGATYIVKVYFAVKVETLIPRFKLLEGVLRAKIPLSSSLTGILAFAFSIDLTQIQILEHYVEGQTIKKYIGSKEVSNKENPAFMFRLIHGVVNVFVELKEYGFLHLDLKGDNFIYGKNKQVKLIDMDQIGKEGKKLTSYSQSGGNLLYGGDNTGTLTIIQSILAGESAPYQFGHKDATGDFTKIVEARFKKDKESKDLLMKVHELLKGDWDLKDSAKGSTKMIELQKVLSSLWFQANKLRRSYLRKKKSNKRNK